MLPKHAFAVIVVLAAFLLLPTAAEADPIVMTLDPTHTVAPGGTATFQGTFSNGGPPSRFVNAVSFTFTGGFAPNFTFNPDAFFNAVPLNVPAGFSTGLVNFFDIAVSPLVAPGTYTGSFSALGGATDSENFTLATASFTLIVQAAPQPVPEPATMLLLGTGLIGIAAKMRKRRKIV